PDRTVNVLHGLVEAFHVRGPLLRAGWKASRGAALRRQRKDSFQSVRQIATDHCRHARTTEFIQFANEIPHDPQILMHMERKILLSKVDASPVDAFQMMQLLRSARN